MLFKKSKRKQLTEIKYELYLLRSGMEVQKEHAVHLAETYGNKEDYSKHIENIYNYMIEKVKKIENIK